MLASLSFRSTTSASDRQTEFQREVATRFGLVPNFFSSAPDAPEIIERLWAFAIATTSNAWMCRLTWLYRWL
jgi:hypothetical protein